MKKFLLPENGQFYKANLHCHTTVSDGTKTPEEVKEIYKSLGYSVVAYTDHDILIPHPELCDDTFIALNGFETETNNHTSSDYSLMKTCHVCYIAIKQDNYVQPNFNINYAWGNALSYEDKVKFDETKGFVREYSGENVSKMMQNARDRGFFITYNHPTWSCEHYNDYMGYNGMHAFEMFNGSCLSNGYDDYNPRVYDDLLSKGQKLYCVAGDDNHNFGCKTPYTCGDSGVACTVIKAPSLTYENITNALVDGNFYATNGPEIKALWFEDGKVHIECSDAAKINYSTAIRHAGVAYPEGDKPLTSAEFEVFEKDKYFRLTVTDAKGNHACTNAYWTKELF